ncbi:hypothetical protein, partial [Kaarinaea lacus]
LPYLGNLNVVDATDFTQHTISTHDLVDATTLQSFEYHRTSNSYYNFQSKYVVYIDNNKLWKLDLNSTSNLVPRPVINTDVSNNCIRENYSHLASYPLSTTNPEKAMVLYETSGNDGDCSTIADNRHVMIRVDQPSNTGPVDVTDKTNFGRIQVLFNRTNSGASDILVEEYSTNTIYRYDSNFENPTTLISGTTTTRLVDTDFVSIDGVFIVVDDDLYWYDANTHSLSSSLFTHSNAWNIFTHCDNTHCYFTVKENSTAYSIYRINADGSSSAEPFALDASISSAFLLGPITDNYIFTYTYLYEPQLGVLQTTELHKIPKTGGEPILIDTSDVGLHLRYANESHIYYEKLDEIIANGGNQTNTATAMVIDQNDAVVHQYPNAMWVGTQFTPHSEKLNASKLLLLRNIQELGNFSGAELQVFDLTTNQVNITLGALPEGAEFVSDIYGFSNSVLAFISFDEPNVSPLSYSNDVFALDFTRENSLTRITNTPDISESRIY